MKRQTSQVPNFKHFKTLVNTSFTYKLTEQDTKEHKVAKLIPKSKGLRVVKNEVQKSNSLMFFD